MIEIDLVHVSVGNAGIIVVLGMAVVFLGIILLMFVVQIMSRLTGCRNQANTAEHIEQHPAFPEPAPGSAGDLKLYDTDPRDAALIMAIVADQLGKPLNELRFKSIREIHDQNSK